MDERLTHLAIVEILLAAIPPNPHPIHVQPSPPLQRPSGVRVYDRPMSRPATSSPAPARPRTQANRLGLDYRAEARRLGPPVAPIIDIHTHINGARAARIYREARDLYGVVRTYSMSQLEGAPDVQEALGETVRFIAVPSYMAENRAYAMREGFLEAIHRFHELGSRMVKFWAAPRRRDLMEQAGLSIQDAALDGEWNRRALELATSLGMMVMTHVADPDTWFATKYADARRYGAKLDQYAPLERMLDSTDVPWIAAHMGGWPEDLDFLDALLERHDNLYLDCSATKWIVRELSRHPTDRVQAFFDRWRGRVLYGSDIVTMDAHLDEQDDPFGKGSQASSEQEAFELYASRYWAYRTLLETDYDGESPIADPDLKMLDPRAHDDFSAPPLKGLRLSRETLRSLYHDAAVNLVERWHDEHP